ncbi:MAG: hypothetical protein U5L45_10775 [Saprospiraceae bacterium]|nr:hypothetical protein [Saprospiraceae bacterium]
MRYFRLFDNFSGDHVRGTFKVPRTSVLTPYLLRGIFVSTKIVKEPYFIQSLSDELNKVTTIYNS